jgi:hypothetical protein
MTKWFGPDWGAPVCRESQQVLTPEGPCLMCKGPVEPGNQGFVMPMVHGSPENLHVEENAIHIECFLLHVGAIKEVHVLCGGFALCGIPGVPADWPDGHRWVRKEDRGRATCSICKRLAADA